MKLVTRIQRSLAEYARIYQRMTAQKGARETLFGVVITVTLLSGYFLHQYWVRQREESAFVALQDVMHAYTKAQQAVMSIAHDDMEKIAQEWESVEVLLEALEKEHAGSYLAPYFSLYRAQISLSKGEGADAARALVDRALGQMSSGSAMWNQVKLLHIRLSFDSTQDDVKAKALQDLQKMAASEKDIAWEEATYLLGVYHSSQGQEDAAHAEWQKIVDKANKDMVLSSPWLKLVQERLQIIE